MATWSTPKTWAVGEALTANDMNTYVSDNLDYLKETGEIGARVYNSANISIPHSTYTELTFDSERYDPDDMHSIVSNTGRITINEAGRYLIGGNVYFATHPTGNRALMVDHYPSGGGGPIIIAFGNLAGVSGMYTAMNVNTTYELAAGDYLTLEAYQSSGGALNISASPNYSPEFWVERIGD